MFVLSLFIVLKVHSESTTVGGTTTLSIGNVNYSHLSVSPSWIVETPSVLELVSGQGYSTIVVKGLAAGTGYVTCNYYTEKYDSNLRMYVVDGSMKTKTFTVSVSGSGGSGGSGDGGNSNVDGNISFALSTYRANVGDDIPLIAQCTSDLRFATPTSWVSSAPSVAELVRIQYDNTDSKAIFNAKKVGTTTISATRAGKTATITVVVSSAAPEPTSISLNYTSVNLTEGGTRQLSATVLPSGASQNVTWSVVSGSGIASVSSSGLVTALAAGTATIRATSTINSYVYANCTITVTAASLTPGTWSDNTLTIGGNATSSVHEVPYGNYYQYSTAQMLYTPTEIGKSGTINSIAFKVASSSSFATSEVKVYLGHKSSKFSSATNYVTSGNLTLVYSGSPTLGSATGWETLTFNKGSFTYNGTDNLVVVVTRKSTSYTDQLKYYCYSGSGYTLYRRSDDDSTYGNATNTSNSYNTSTNRPSIRMGFVDSNTPTSISLNTTSVSLEVGGTKQLSATVSPSGASQSVTWSVVSGSNVASVSSSGLVTANATGTATIRATSSANSSIYKDCTVTVTEAVLEPGIWSDNTLTIGGNATSSFNDAPYGNFYHYSTAQMLYTPTEIGKSGTINSIAFKVASSLSFATSEVKVYLGHKSSKFSSSTNYVTSGNLTLVYSGSPTLGSATGWETLTFNQGSFTYNGTDNLVVVVTRKSSSYTDQLKYYCYSGSGYTLYRRNDEDSTYGDVTNTSNSYNASTNRPAIRMEFAVTPTSISLNTTSVSLEVGGTQQLTATVLPSGASQNVTWSVVSGSNVASVSSSGLVTANATGTATIRATSSANSAIYTDCTVTVIESSTLMDGDYFESTTAEGYLLRCVVVSAEDKTCRIGGQRGNDDFYWYGVNLNVTGKVTIPEYANGFKVICIGQQAFQNHSNITDITIPESVTNIGAYAFLNCTGLTSVILPKSLVSVGNSSFEGCTNLTGVQISDLDAYCRISFGWYAPLFYAHHLYLNGKEVTGEVTFPNNISSVSTCAFEGCYGITSVVIPEGITQIGQAAFKGMKDLRAVTLPSTLANVAVEAFQNCSNLTSITINRENPPTAYANTFSNSYDATLYVPYGTKAQYEATAGWNQLDIKEMPIEVDGFYYMFGKASGLNEDIGQNVLPSNDDIAVVVAAPEGHEYSGDIILPSSITYNGQTYTVAALGGDTYAPFAEYKSTVLRSVVIPNSVVYIGEEAFVESTTLQRVEIPSSVVYIGHDAFADCESLTEIVSYIQTPFEIPTDVFRDIAANAILYVPNGTKALYQATVGWNQLNIVEMEEEDPAVFTAESTNGVPMTFKITDEANKTCQIGTGTNAAINTNYNGKVVLPRTADGYTVTAIAANAFANCTGIYAVYIPNTITAIGENAFNGCRSLDEVESYIEEPFDIPESAFENIADYASLDILYGTKTKYQAVNGWDVFDAIYSETAIVNGLRYSVNGAVVEDKGDPYTAWVHRPSKWDTYKGDIVIPETLVIGDESFTVVGIDDGAFLGSQITSVTIPSTVTSIDSGAFKDCSQLQRVTSYIMEPKNESDAFINIPSDATLYVPAGTLALYEATACWKKFANIVEMEPATPQIIDVDGIYYTISYARDALNDIEQTVYRSDEEVAVVVAAPTDGHVYSGDVVIPSSITYNGKTHAVVSIASQAFDGSLLTSVVIPESVTTIGEGAFRSCSGLISITILEGVISIGRTAFAYCSALTSITIPESVTSIGADAFSDCRVLTCIAIPESVTSIGESAFHCCSGLMSIVVDPKNPNYNSRDNCNAIIQTTTNALVAGCNNTIIPEGVTSIVEYVFENCSGLNSITLPESVTSIGRETFRDCSGLISVTIPGSVTEIGLGAFVGCVGLTDIICLINNPFPIDDVFRYYDYDNDYQPHPLSATLHVPAGTKALYETTRGWNQLTIVEMEPEPEVDTDISQLDNVLYVENKNIFADGLNPIYLKMNNTTDISAIECVLELPEGMTFDSMVLLPNRVRSRSNFIASATPISEHRVHVIIYPNPNNSNDETCFIGNSGEVARIKIETAADVEIGDYPLLLKNVKISDRQGEEPIMHSYIKSTLTVIDGVLGDANGNDDVEVGDIMAIINYMSEHPSSKFQKGKADVNGDGDVDISDIMGTVNTIIRRIRQQYSEVKSNQIDPQ